MQSPLQITKDSCKRLREANSKVNFRWHRVGKTNNLGQILYEHHHHQDNDQKGTLSNNGTDWQKNVHRKAKAYETKVLQQAIDSRAEDCINIIDIDWTDGKTDHETNTKPQTIPVDEMTHHNTCFMY